MDPEAAENDLPDLDADLIDQDDAARTHSLNLPHSDPNIWRTKSNRFQYVPGRMNMLSRKYESLDYDIIESDLYVKEESMKGACYFFTKSLLQWCIFGAIGCLTAVVASTVDMTIDFIIQMKFSILNDFLESEKDAYVTIVAWMSFNILPMCIGSFLVTYWAPSAAGSGIPAVKCFLNGIWMPDSFTLTTLVIKAIGLICTVVGGVTAGKEGPMIHVGAAVAANICRGSFLFNNKQINIFRHFRHDAEQRDFISGGAATGVSAAFGASVGIPHPRLCGVLFSLEQGSSFWNQGLTVKIFFATAVTTFTVNLILSWYYGNPGNLLHTSLINLGNFNFNYEIYELPVFALIGCIGGLSAALWNFTNLKLNVLRLLYIKKKYLRVVEACAISGFTGLFSYIMTRYMAECTTVLEDLKYTTNAYCPGKEVNIIGSMWLKSPQNTLTTLLHAPLEAYSFAALAVFTAQYYLVSCVSFGMSCSIGAFVTNMLIGAAWGRIFIMAVSKMMSGITKDHCEKYTLIAAAAQLGGTVRMTISLSVIIMETSDNLSMSLPIIITLMCAKWTGDFFGEALHDFSIKIKAVPYLEYEPPFLSQGIFATDIMNKPPICLRPVERIEYVLKMLLTTSHNGFPIVKQERKIQLGNFHELRIGKLVGLVLRSQIVILLHKKLFFERYEDWRYSITMAEFKDNLMFNYTMDDITLTEDEKMMRLDFTHFMNKSPYSTLHTASLPKIFRLFRTMGLRHLPIVNESNEVVGMVTRKDISRYRCIRRRGTLQLQTWAVV